MAKFTHKPIKDINSRVRAYARKAKIAVGSNMYPGGLFIASRSLGGVDRQWYVIRYNSKNRSFHVVADHDERLAGARGTLKGFLAMLGYSTKSAPTNELTDRQIPQFPVGAIEHW
jgi:hypothetical protein